MAKYATGKYAKAISDRSGNSIPDLSDIAFENLPVAYFAIIDLGNML